VSTREPGARLSAFLLLAVSPHFFHNGAFRTIGRAIRHHLDPASSGRRFSLLRNDEPSDLAKGPIEPVIAAGIDPELATPLELEKRERNRLKTFVKRALLDPRVLEFCALVPESLPSNRPVAKFEGCQ